MVLWVVDSELNQTMFSSIIIKNSNQWKQMQPSFFSAAVQPGFMPVYGVRDKEISAKLSDFPKTWPLRYQHAPH